MPSATDIAWQLRKSCLCYAATAVSTHATDFDIFPLNSRKTAKICQCLIFFSSKSALFDSGDVYW